MLEKIFPKSHLEPSDIFIITVPSNKIGKKQDLKPLLSVISRIGKLIKKIILLSLKLHRKLAPLKN